MKLLLDENISHRTRKYIAQNFPNSLHVSNIKERIMTDLEIWEYAVENDFIIVTYDQDFYEWQQLRGFPPYIVWLRFGNTPTRKIALSKTIQSLEEKFPSLIKKK